MAGKEENTMPYIPVFVPKGSRNKYEYNHKTGRFVLDRMLFSSVHYPADYGFIPETLAADGDELDVLVLTGDPTFPGCQVMGLPVAMLEMWDEKGRDEKIIAISREDPLWGWIKKFEDVPPHLLREISHFFSIYKELEGKKTEIGSWYNKEQAWKTIHQAEARYKEIQQRQQK
jgi:inorganic pyrophosphatase